MNNSATTRMISKIAFEYNGNDKGMAILADSNFLLGSNPDDQFQEMKAVAGRNSKVKKWALTGYISSPEEIGKSLSNSELTDLAIEALKKVGVTDQNQFRLDIHNSTKHKHIHFIVNRINIHGKCTVKAHDVGKRFGESVRQVCQERNLKTDVEIGIEKRAAILTNLTEVIKHTNDFNDLILEMKNRGYVVQLSKNEKIGISGMRIILESDINNQTQRQYKPGYKLSEISNTLKIAEIKNIFELKSLLLNELKTTTNWKDLRENLFKKGWYLRIQYKGEFKTNQRNEIQDILIKKVGRSETGQPKHGYFFKKYDGFYMSAIENDFKNYAKEIPAVGAIKNIFNSSSFPHKSISENLKEIAEELIDEFLKPNYVAQEDEWWKKKRKMKI